MGWEAAWYSEIEAFPKAVLAHHYPDVPDLGDMNNIEQVIRGDKIEAPDVLVGGTPCFPNGTFVLCKRGLLPIEQIRVGDYVWTHKCRWRCVEKVMSRVADTIILKGYGHPGLETTSEHPFYSMQKHQRFTRVNNKAVRLAWRTGPEWSPSSNMEGKFWATPIRYARSNIPRLEIRSYEGRNLPNGFDKDFFWFLGLWLGDGWIRTGQRSDRPKGQTNGYVLVCGHKKDRDVLSDRLAATGLKFTTSEEKTTVRFQIVSKPLNRWILKNFGQYCGGKRIPSWMFGIDEELKGSFLDGYLFADGSRCRRTKGSGMYYTSSSVGWELTVSMRMLCASLKKPASVLKCSKRTHSIIEGRRVRIKPIYQFILPDTPRSAYIEDDFVWGKVKKVVEGRKQVAVHNLQVKEDESYTADGYVVHNCTSFSIAGARKSLSDERGVGNLALTYVRIANAIDDIRLVRGLPGVVTVWENVPGVLSTKDNAFGCLLGALAGEDVPLEPPRGKWKDAGYVLGPKRAVAWRCLDAQYAGLAQRRKRVFLVSGPREWFRPQEVLFEWEGRRRDTAPSREKGQNTPTTVKDGSRASGPGFDVTGFDVTGSLCTRRRGGGGFGTDFDCSGSIICDKDSMYDMHDNGDGKTVNSLVGDNTNRVTDYTPVAMIPDPYRDTAATLTSKFAGASHQWAPYNEADNLIQVKSVIPFDTTQITSPLNYSRPKDGDPCHPLASTAHPPAVYVKNGTINDSAMNLQSGGTVDFVATQGVAYGCDLSQKAEGIGFKEEQAPCVAPGTHPGHGSHAVVAFGSKDHGGDALEDVSPTIRSDSHNMSHPNSGAPHAVAFKPSHYTRDKDGAPSEVCPPLTKEADKGDQDPIVMSTSQESFCVRRLTPEECEVLMGFPKGYTKIPWRGKPPEDCPDGNRYKALGNSMAVTVMAWIGKRLDAYFKAMTDGSERSSA